MRRRIVSATLILFASALVLYAADFWEQKEPDQWTTEEVERMLIDSPWAQEAQVRFVGDPGAPIGGSGRGGGIGLPGQRRGSSGTGGISLPDGGWGGKFASVGTESRAFREGDIVALWSSSLPVRRALQLVGAAHIEKRPELLKDFYIVSLSRIPPGMARLADTPDKLRAAARLTPKGRTPIRAEHVEVRPQPGTPGIDLYFPRSANFSFDDRQIVFDLVAEDYEVIAKFKPRSMLYGGQLAL